MPCELTPNNFIPCPSLKLAIHDNYWNSRKKGLHVCQLTNVKTLESRVAGVAYRFDKSLPPIFIDYCPFCGTEIHQQQRGNPIASNDPIRANRPAN